MEDTPRTDAGQGNFASTLLALALECKGGYLPPRGSGAFSTVVWGRLLGRTEQTISRWIADLEIPHMRAGKQQYVSADHMWDALIKAIPDESQEQ